MNSIEFIEDINLKFNQKKIIKYMLYSLQIMSQVHIIDVKYDDFLDPESSQGF